MRSRLYAGNHRTVDIDHMNTLTVRDTTNHSTIKSNEHITLDQPLLHSIDSSESIFLDQLDYFSLSTCSSSSPPAPASSSSSSFSQTQVTDVSSFFNDSQVSSLVNYQWENGCPFDTTAGTTCTMHSVDEQIDTNSISNPNAVATFVPLDQNSFNDICSSVNPFDSPCLSELIDLLPVSPCLQSCQL